MEAKVKKQLSVQAFINTKTGEVGFYQYMRDVSKDKQFTTTNFEAMDFLYGTLSFLLERYADPKVPEEVRIGQAKIIAACEERMEMLIWCEYWKKYSKKHGKTVW